MAGTPWKRLLLPGIATLAMLAVLIGLGTWQVTRLHWKNDLLARIVDAEAAPAIPMPATPDPWTKVATTGRFDHAREALLGLEVRGPVLGAHLLVPLLREAAPALLVNRGWVPLQRAAPLGRPEGLVTVEGFVRPGDSRSIFAATDDAPGRRFYTFDPPAIGAALGLPVAPFGLVVLGPQGAPDPARSLPRPTNSHLGYAITWYGLALALLGVFAAWARLRLKEPA